MAAVSDQPASHHPVAAVHTADETLPAIDPARPRVLIIVENLPCPFDRRVWNEATTLRRAGHQVCIICPTGPGSEAHYEELDGVHIYRHGLPLEARRARGFVLEYSAALLAQVALSLRIRWRHGFDVIHACNPPDLIFLVAWLHKLFGTRFVFDHHDLCPELFEAKFEKRGFLYRLMLLLERLTFATADLSIATNESYRDIAIRRGRMAPERVFVVRSGPSLDRMRIEAPDPALKRGRRHLVAYVGVMGAQEGIDLLLDAVEHLVRELGHDDIHFLLMGSGPARAQLEREVLIRGLNTHVEFAGRVSDAFLVRALNTADVCVNPDRPNEMNDKSTMNKIMEYMAVGKPIVQFELTEGRRTAHEASLYATPGDTRDFAAKIAALLADEARRREMGDYGRRRIEDVLEWRHEAPKLLSAYRTLPRK
ncbi:MAG: glycosyltransferase family 4 protein [Gammaproteobacteria bacterium]